MPAWLTTVRGRDVGQMFEVADSQAATLGRSVKCDIRVPDGQASRSHCRVERIGNDWSITDLGSSNGTFVNEERVTEATLRSGDVILVGTTAYKLTIDAMPDAGDLGGTEVLVEEESSDLVEMDAVAVREAADPEGEAEPLELADESEAEPVCAQCGRKLAPDAAARGNATEIGGRLYCSRCVVHHAESEPAPESADPGSDSSEFESLLRSLERATEADRVDEPPASASPPDAPEPPPQKRGLLDRLRRKRPPQ